jgi:hypothetical protein
VARFLVAGLDLPTGYSKGDIVTVRRNGAPWGRREGLPKFWHVDVADIPYPLAIGQMVPLWEPALVTDPEWDSPDEADRRINRHRRKIRVMWDEVPAAWITTLDTVGLIELTAAEVRPFVRFLRWNRGQGGVEKTPNEVF